MTVTTSAAANVDWDALIHEDRVHGSLYTDPAVWAAELEQIWYRTWIFVGHVSEVPEPNDYVLKSIGPQPVIMTRDRDGEIRLLLNRCSHRANQVCDFQHGNTTTFRCPYHGWTFSNTGALLGYPFSSGYGGRDRKADLGLAAVPRVAEIHGFVFGSFATDGPTLADHLGPAATAFDRLTRLSPTGRIELTCGWLQHEVRANWKMLLENETDGYHPQFVHSSIFGVADSGIGDLYGERSAAVVRDLGNGHTEDDLRPEFRRIGEPLGWFGTRPERVPDYVRAMRDAYGDAADEILIDGSPHVMIFPNLFIAEIQLFVLQPRAVDAPCSTSRRSRSPVAMTSTAGCCSRPSGRSDRPASCSPTTPTCTSATSAACSRGRRSGWCSSAGSTASGSTPTGSPSPTSPTSSPSAPSGVTTSS